jgi:bifunctional non-homologous end joining protein LigD
VGTGFSDRQLGDLRLRLDAERRDSPAATGALPSGRDHVWTNPEIVCEVRYKEWTGDRQLRHPVFLRLRDDKKPEECLAPEERSEKIEEIADLAPPADRTVRLTNLEKVFWPEEGHTKGDLIAYYRAISPWILPYLRDRPLVMTRYPDGIQGKSFFQKDAPGFGPDWLRKERMWSEHGGREIDYFVCDDEASLLYVINLGTIPLHVWSSRVPSLQRPDWCILDLDPKGAPFGNVVKVALAARRLCRDIELPAYLKTSGSTGLHVLIPLGRQCTFEDSRMLGELLARVLVTEMGEIATIARALDARDGKVYIDFLQNGHGKLLVAPFSARPVPGAQVSTPLRWSEATARLDPKRFTIETVPARMKKLKEDPIARVLEGAPDLSAALGHLGSRVKR